MLTALPIAMVVLFALPFICNEGEKHWRRRPVSVVVVVLIYVGFGILTYLGKTSPWSPHMEAWTSDPVPRHFMEGRSPLELQGAILLQQKQCRNCHAIDGVGGQRGPDLSTVGMRLTNPQLTRQIIQGGGNMPAYGDNLSPAEVDALVAYMVSLRPSNVSPARDTTLPADFGNR